MFAVFQGSGGCLVLTLKKMESLNMLIKSLKSLVVAVACLLSVNSFAGLITDVETFGSGQKLNAFQQFSWTHNILDQGFTFGTAESASIKIAFRDDEKKFFKDGFEFATIQIGFVDLQDGSLLTIPTASWFGDLGLSSLAKLNADGTLFVQVTSTLGDFFVDSSTLSVVTSDVGVSVPETSSLMLFGLGLLGLGLMRRKLRA